MDVSPSWHMALRCLNSPLQFDISPGGQSYKLSCWFTWKIQFINKKGVFQRICDKDP
jgi:hypothetical protein